MNMLLPKKKLKSMFEIRFWSLNFLKSGSKNGKI